MSSSTPTPTSAIELTEQWHWEGWTTADEEAHGGAVDSDGNLLLVGIQNNEVITYNDDLYASGGSEDFAAVKIEGASGEVLWTYVGSSTGYETDILLDCDTDSNNDVYVAGYTQGFWTMSNAPNSRHLMCAKLDGSTGTDIWRYQTTAPSSTTEDYIYYGSGMVSGVAVNGEDDVFLVGYTYNSLVYGEGTTDNRDYVAIKLDGETGERIFTVQGGSDFEHDELRAAKCDASGDLVAVGMRGDDNEDGEYHVIKLSGVDGSVMWEYAALSTSTIDLLNDIDFDHDGNVLVGGGKGAETMHGRTAETPVVLKLSGATGAVMWTYEGDAELGTIFRAVAVHPDTAWVVAAGVTEGSWLNGAANAGETDFAAVVLDGATGEELLRYQDGTDGDEAVMTAEFDSAGGLFLGGWTNGTWSADDNGSGGDGLNVAAVKLVLSQDNVIVSGTGSASDSALLSTGEVMAIGFSGAALILVAALCTCHRSMKRKRKGKEAARDTVVAGGTVRPPAVAPPVASYDVSNPVTEMEQVAPATPKSPPEVERPAPLYAARTPPQQWQPQTPERTANPPPPMYETPMRDSAGGREDVAEVRTPCTGPGRQMMKKGRETN